MSSDKKEELFGIKLKIRNKSTPSPTWQLGFDHLHDSSSFSHNFPMNTSVSARKIAANLWEVQPQFEIVNDGGSRLTNHHRRREKKGSDEEPPPPPLEIETLLRRKIRELPSLHDLSTQRNSQSQQHVSSASYCSSMEMTPYVRAVTPTDSFDFSGFKTSTHVLKVLNRIWNLEAQQSTNVALVKALKREVNNSRAQIKTLIEDRKRDHQEIDELKKSIEYQTKKSTQSAKDELEVERKLRKHSESLQHKISQELLTLRSSHLNTVDELKREKKARILLENLCDEFAKGIQDYEHVVRFLKQKLEKKDRIKSQSQSQPDRLILHVSEAWLDERAQARFDFSEKKSISDNLSFEIETFLQARQKQSIGSNVEDDKNRSRGRFLDSIRLNEDENDPKDKHYEEKSNKKMFLDNDNEENVQSKNNKLQKPKRDIAKNDILKEKEDKNLICSTKEDKNVTVRELIARMTGGELGEGEACSRWIGEGGKEHTLMAKLIEARLESQLSRSRTVRR